jgi:hypothetical protein
MAGKTAHVPQPSTQTETAGHDSVVAVYDSHAAAEAAVRKLAKSGFDMKTLSIIGKDYSTEEGVVGFYNAGDRMKAWGKTGAFWGGLWGMLFGSALFVIPGVGPLFAAGPLVAWIVGALEGAAVVGGMSALGAGLYSVGIPKDSILNYETQIKAGKFVVIAHGPSSQVEKSQTILSDAACHSGTAHNCCG